jgi:hypothetical protein
MFAPPTTPSGGVAGRSEIQILTPRAAKGWEWDDEWKPNSETRFPKGTSIPSKCYQMLKQWRQEGKADNKERGRIGELALRVALVSASANHESTVSEGCMQAALRFMEWQESIRITYEAGVAENQDAVITGAIIAKLMSYGKDPDTNKYKWVKWWPMYRKTGWRKKWGSPKLKYIKAAMIEDGTIEEEIELESNDGGDKKVKTGRVRFRG